VPGLLHSIHNTTNDVLIALTHGQAYVEQLRQLVRLLSQKHSQQRLLESCFFQPQHSLFRSEIQKFHASVDALVVYKHRAERDVLTRSYASQTHRTYDNPRGTQCSDTQAECKAKRGVGDREFRAQRATYHAKRRQNARGCTSGL